MTEQELVKTVAAAPQLAGKDIPKASVEAVLDALGDAVTHALAGGEKVSLPGLGKLNTEPRAARTGRNPRTGAPVAVPAKKVAKFVPGKKLKDALNPAT